MAAYTLRDRRRPRLLGSLQGRCCEQGRRSLGVTIGEGAWTGAGAKILDGVSIGAHAVIGAGAVVRDDVIAAAGADSPVGQCRPACVSMRTARDVLGDTSTHAL